MPLRWSWVLCSLRHSLVIPVWTLDILPLIPRFPAISRHLLPPVCRSGLDLGARLLPGTIVGPPVRSFPLCPWLPSVQNPANHAHEMPAITPPRFAKRTSIMGEQTGGGLGKPNPASSRILIRPLSRPDFAFWILPSSLKGPFRNFPCFPSRTARHSAFCIKSHLPLFSKMLTS